MNEVVLTVPALYHLWLNIAALFVLFDWSLDISRWIVRKVELFLEGPRYVRKTRKRFYYTLKIIGKDLKFYPIIGDIRGQW